MLRNLLTYLSLLLLFHAFAIVKWGQLIILIFENYKVIHTFNYKWLWFFIFAFKYIFRTYFKINVKQIKNCNDTRKMPGK